MKTKLLLVMALFKLKKEKKKKEKHCNLSASLSYPDILGQTIKIIPTKLVNTQYHTISDIPVQKDTLG